MMRAECEGACIIPKRRTMIELLLGSLKQRHPENSMLGAMIWIGKLVMWLRCASMQGCDGEELQAARGTGIATRREHAMRERVIDNEI